MKTKKFEELEVNDWFYMDYGYQTLRFRVEHKISNEKIMAHSFRWLRGSSIRITKNEALANEFSYGGRLSFLDRIFKLIF